LSIIYMYFSHRKGKALGALPSGQPWFEAGEQKSFTGPTAMAVNLCCGRQIH
jgi:hypothetical protein